MSLEEVTPRLAHLVHRKDDPFAWAEIAGGYRRSEIRFPVEDALRTVGVDRCYAMVKTDPGGWGKELVSFLEAEIAKARAKRRDNSFELSWDAYRYLLEDS
jgi:hypothetical protein